MLHDADAYFIVEIDTTYNDSIWLEPLKFFMFWFFFKSGEFFRLKETSAKLIGG